MVDRVVAWLRLPDLPATHYDKFFLFNLGNAIGKAIKVDVPIAQRGRGKFARLCVELDLTTPLVSKFSIKWQVHVIRYECMSLLCLHCGRYGHVREACSERMRLQKEQERMKEKKEVCQKEVDEDREEGEILEKPKEERPWKMVQKSWRPRRSAFPGTNVRVSNRFMALLTANVESKGGRPLADVTNQAGKQEVMESRKVEVVEKRKMTYQEMENDPQGVVERTMKSEGINVRTGSSKVEQQNDLHGRKPMIGEIAEEKEVKEVRKMVDREERDDEVFGGSEKGMKEVKGR